MRLPDHTAAGPCGSPTPSAEPVGSKSSPNFSLGPSPALMTLYHTPPSSLGQRIPVEVAR